MRRTGIISAVLAGFFLVLIKSGAAISGTQVAFMMSAKADRVVVLKTERKLILLQGDYVLRVYRIALGRYPTGHKQQKRRRARTR
jgi:hypothetical protein